MISQLLRTIERQDEIITLQSTTIDELCQLLATHVSPEEFADLEVMRKINRAVRMKEALERKMP